VTGHVLIIERRREFARQLQTRLAGLGLSVVFQQASAADALRPEEGSFFDVLVQCVDTVDGEGLLTVSNVHAGLEAVFQPPFDLDLLAMAVGNSIQRADNRVDAAHEQWEGLLGRSPAMQSVRSLISRLALSQASVLITGETGTGKEVAAHLLHSFGRRSSGPFVAVNCASLPEALLESELFGHTRGAFTDAREKRSGLLVHAHGGTLFLDEIGELPLSLQPRLLRALQERVVRPVGSDTEVPFSVRLVSATHRDLQAEIDAGRFRQDLYYRLDVVQLDLPPLRARGSDIDYLAHAFLRRFCRVGGKGIRGFSPEVMTLLRRYSWPGNVRELQNCIERAVALCSTPYVMPGDLPGRLQTAGAPDVPPPPSVAPDELISLSEVERRHMARVLEAVHGNKRAAAQILGMDRRTLYRKLKRW
jgi:two-component system, NtrC family, response regulator AtoC